MKSKLLMLTPELPYPLQSGGKVKTWNMIQFFAKQWDITLVCPLKENDADHVDEFSRHAPIEKLITDSVRVPRSAKNLLKSYVVGKPLNLVRTYSHTLSNTVAKIVDDYDLVLVDHYEVFQLLPQKLIEQSVKRPAVVYHAHNAYHQIWQRYSETTLNPAKKLVTAIESLRVRKAEQSICEQSDLVFAAPNDIETLAAFCDESVRFKQTLHLGDDANLDKPALDVKLSQPKLCYVGFLGWEPNVQGLLWFLENVWPNLKAEVADLKLEIAGKNPDARLVKAVEQAEGVELLGFVEDLETLYRGSRVAICPLQFGSGIKVKVANSMARGMPTVTTSVGAEGLDVHHGVHLMIADEAQDMASSILTLLNNDRLWSQISNSSRHLMRLKYTWKALFKGMIQDIHDVQQLQLLKQAEQERQAHETSESFPLSTALGSLQKSFS